MSAANLQPIEALLSLVIDAINDGVQVIGSGQPPIVQIGVFTNLIADLVPVLSSISQLPASLAGFSQSDANALVAFVESKIKVPNAKAQAIVNAALQVAQSAYSLVIAIKS